MEVGSLITKMNNPITKKSSIKRKTKTKLRIILREKPDKILNRYNMTIMIQNTKRSSIRLITKIKNSKGKANSSNGTTKMVTTNTITETKTTGTIKTTIRNRINPTNRTERAIFKIVNIKNRLSPFKEGPINKSMSSLKTWIRSRKITKLRVRIKILRLKGMDFLAIPTKEVGKTTTKDNLTKRIGMIIRIILQESLLIIVLSNLN